MASVSGVANKALALGGTGTVVNAHHIQQVAEHVGTYPATAEARTKIPPKYKAVIDDWVKKSTAAKVKNLKSKRDEIVAILKAQLFEEKHPNLEAPLAEVEMVITTAVSHRKGHTMIAAQERAAEKLEITAPAED